MAEQTQSQQQVMPKDPKKFEAGKRLAEYNRKREEIAHLVKAQSEPKLTYNGAGAVVAIEALGIYGYCVYQFKKTPTETLVYQTNETKVRRPKETPANKFEMRK